MAWSTLVLHRSDSGRPLLAGYPATTCLVVAYVTLGLLARGLLHDSFPSIQAYVGWDLDTLKGLHYWQQIPGSLFQSPQGFKGHEIVSLVVCATLLEKRAGSRALLVTFFVSDFVASLLATLGIWWAATLGSTPASTLLHHPSSGASAATLACAAAIAATLPGYVAVIATGAMLGAVLQSFTYQGLDTSFAHLFASIIGILLGVTICRRPSDTVIRAT